jgi:hypothetical protein
MKILSMVSLPQLGIEITASTRLGLALVSTHGAAGVSIQFRLQRERRTRKITRFSPADNCSVQGRCCRFGSEDIIENHHEIGVGAR